MEWLDRLDARYWMGWMLDNPISQLKQLKESLRIEGRYAKAKSVFIENN
jgi:hypothetical protein